MRIGVAGLIYDFALNSPLAQQMGDVPDKIITASFESCGAQEFCANTETIGGRLAEFEPQLVGSLRAISDMKEDELAEAITEHFRKVSKTDAGWGDQFIADRAASLLRNHLIAKQIPLINVDGMEMGDSIVGCFRQILLMVLDEVENHKDRIPTPDLPTNVAWSYPLPPEYVPRYYNLMVLRDNPQIRKTRGFLPFASQRMVASVEKDTKYFDPETSATPIQLEDLRRRLRVVSVTVNLTNPQTGTRPYDRPELRAAARTQVANFVQTARDKAPNLSERQQALLNEIDTLSRAFDYVLPKRELKQAKPQPLITDPPLQPGPRT
jgi:hypothetical protein